MTGNIVIFDGVCNLCNALVAFIIARDQPGSIRFAAMQSDAGQQLIAEYDVPVNNLDSVVLIKEGAWYLRTDAALEVARELNRPWRWCYVLRHLPKGFRDFCYQVVANNRYRWFGRREHCMVPTRDLQDRFITEWPEPGNIR